MRKLLIADCSEDFRLALAGILQKRCHVLCCGTGTEALDILRKEHPDVFVLDLALPELDGVTMLEMAAAEGLHPNVLATTSLLTDYVVESAQRLGIAYLIRKPCSVQAVAARAEDLCRGPKPEAPKQEPRSLVSEHLLTFSIATKHNGFGYLTEAVIMTAKNPRISVTKELYPAVAKIFGCEKGHVERSIRSALEAAWDHRNEQVWQEYFPNAVRRPTNAQFISRLAQTLRSKME